MERENVQETPYRGAAPASAPLPFYDTHAGVRRLTQAGVEESLAEAMISEQLRVVGQNVASHADIARLQHDIARLQQDLRSEIGSVRGEIGSVRGEVETLRGEIKTLQSEVGSIRGDNERFRQEIRAEFQSAHLRLVKWGVGQSMAIILLVVGLIRLL